MLTFHEPTHTYRADGVVVPSVTQVLAGLHTFAHVAPDVLSAAALRGSNVHMACQFLDEDALDESQFTGEELSYLEGWKAFLADHQPNWSAIEVPFHNRSYGYCGTPDRIGNMLLDGTRHNVVIDIKTAAASHPTWSLQTAGYAQGDRTMRRFTVQLSPAGAYKMIEWTDSSDWPIFVAAVTLNRWTRKNNL